jgi:methylated-DNA-[protein]-cysteine S-methyltransferase
VYELGMAATRLHTEIESPIGPLTLIASDGLLSGLFMDYDRYRPSSETFGEPSAEPFQATIEQLGEYFAGERTAFDLQLGAGGTPFQQTVWSALCQIPYGETISYGELAREIGKPSASRAVGLANGSNPISIIVPCHRVIGADGSLTGYGGGLERKRFLLDLEKQRASPALF